MGAVLELIGGLLVWLIILGLLLALAFWAMSNIWLLLGILAALIVIGIIYAMATSDNDLVSGLTNLTLIGIVCFVAYAIFA